MVGYLVFMTYFNYSSIVCAFFGKIDVWSEYYTQTFIETSKYSLFNLVFLMQQHFTNTEVCLDDGINTAL